MVWDERIGVAGTLVHVPVNHESVTGDLTVPPNAEGIVLFAHGSGSSRLSIRNQFVAQVLQRAGLGTLLIDLLTPEEEESESLTAHLRFNINLLARRLTVVTRWLKENSETRSLRIGYFGASTGAAAALAAAAQQPEMIHAVVSRGGRPDLAGTAISKVKAPTLLIVGGEDTPVISLNREAFAQLRSPKEMVIIPGATHLFEEPGALEKVAHYAADWFIFHLAPLLYR